MRPQGYAQAAECYRKVLVINPQSVEAGLGLSDCEYRFSSECGKSNNTSIQISPIAGGPKARAFQLMKSGRIAQGFELLAEIIAHSGAIGAGPLEVIGGSIPQWHGEQCDNLLIIADQGHGDCLQFARYFSLAKSKAKHLTIATYPKLISLFERCEGVEQVISIDLTHTAQADAYTLAFLLPHVLKAGYCPGAYLNAEPRGFGIDGKDINIGVCWAGNPLNPNDGNRSASIGYLEVLRDVPGVVFHSLQVGQSAPEWMIKHTPESYGDTASLIAELDLVISVDTSVAHLAGGMGKPVWIALPHEACWRWERQDTNSNWYETARLFRQPAAGDWSTVFNWMAAEIHNMRTQDVMTCRLFTHDECEQISKTLKSIKQEPARISAGSYKGIIDQSHFRASQAFVRPDHPKLAWVFERILFVMSEAEKVMHTGGVKLAGMASYLTYSSKDHFEWHTDATFGRRITLTVQLTPHEDYEGGCLLLMLDGGRTIRASRDIGMASIFRGERLHRITPIKRGKRQSLVQWLNQ